MRKPTLIATVVLAAFSVVSWYFTSIGPVWFNTTSYPDVQIAMSAGLSFAACLGWVLLVVLDKRRESETHCRKCGYILRGLSEPRCPECGERI
jgi:hypothetical protein